MDTGKPDIGTFSYRLERLHKTLRAISNLDDYDIPAPEHVDITNVASDYGRIGWDLGRDQVADFVDGIDLAIGNGLKLRWSSWPSSITNSATFTAETDAFITLYAVVHSDSAHLFERTVAA